MDDSVLIQKKFNELKAIQESMFQRCNKDCTHGGSIQTADEGCECQKSFQWMLKYLQCNIPSEDLKSHMNQAPIEKTVREIDPVTMEATEPFNGFEKRFDAAGADISGKFWEDAYSLLFFGANGSGKTHTATWLACCAIDEGLSTYYTYMRDLYSVFQKVEYGEPEPIDRRFLDYITNVDFLIIDEVGKETHSETSIAFFEMLIKKRQSLGFPTIVITNLDLFHKDAGGNITNEMSKRYGNSVWDLFKKYFVFQFARQGDFRARVRKKWEI